MARNKKSRSYFEPWSTTKSATIGKQPFADGVPEEIQGEAAERIMDAWFRADRDADWVIWGSRMAENAICKNLDGTISVTSDQRIIAIRRTLGLPDGTPGHEDVARRIVACVNACAGIADPEKFIGDVRALMLAYAHGEGEDPRGDDKVFSLLGRCVPPSELEKLHAIED